jgi:hypothetical protein
MAVTKAKDRIQLSDGSVVTLGEALDAGRLFLKTTEAYGRNATVSIRYVAREVDGDLFWEVGRTLYESRTGAAISAAR